jgi:DNA-binding response OmpR family regulator
MKTAWLIDDDQEMSTAIGLMLKVLGFETRAFLGAPSAGKALLEGPQPDLILLDINMPKVSGKDFLEFLRLRDEYQHLPVVMLSSEYTDVQISEVLDMGADAYVSKPVSTEELGAAIEQAMAKRA